MLGTSSITSSSPHTTCSCGGATFPSKEIVSRSRDGRLVLPKVDRADLSSEILNTPENPH